MSEETQKQSPLPPTPTPTATTTKEDENEKEEWEQQRDIHKSKGDNAFRIKDYKNAILEYTNAITLDPEYHILYSNRSASYLSNNEKSKALTDAKKCISLNPSFVKGHSRLASAMLSLGRFNEARNVYKFILKDLDEDNVVAKKGLEDCRVGENKAKERDRALMRRAQDLKKAKEKAEAEVAAKQEEEERKKRQQEEDQKNSVQSNQDAGGDKNDDDDDDDDDLLNNFFDDVEEVIESKKKKPLTKEKEENNNNSNDNKKENDNDKNTDKPKENKIQIQLSDLGDAKTQIKRILCPNHEWYNLNPYRVLDISHEAPLDLLSRRYKALSLLLHPDKVRLRYGNGNGNGNDATGNDDVNIVEKAEEAFEYIRKANNILKDEDKARHTSALIEQGMKHGKRDYDNAMKENTNTTNGGKKVEEFQNIATMKIFAEIERKRRDVERRKRKFEEREREQEDEEENKSKKERNFDKSWKQEGRVEKRINNWRDFKKK